MLLPFENPFTYVFMPFPQKNEPFKKKDTGQKNLK